MQTNAEVLRELHTIQAQLSDTKQFATLIFVVLAIIMFLLFTRFVLDS